MHEDERALADQRLGGHPRSPGPRHLAEQIIHADAARVANCRAACRHRSRCARVRKRASFLPLCGSTPPTNRQESTLCRSDFPNAIPSEPKDRIMKRSLALALATFLGLGLLSTSFAAFAQDAYGGITNSRGGYGSTGGYSAYTR